VLALLIQHIAVTLGALSLVRERLIGATEFFRVAPVSASQILIGKYLGYTLFIGLITAALTGLMILLGVPFLGSLLEFAGLSLLLILASLGVGLFISAISTSDSQAVQLSMLVLLISIFFSGFFMPLESFWPLLLVVSYALPITHGISGFHNLLLRGVPPSPLAWALLACIATVMAAGSLAMTIRSLRKVV
jgi:ABC-2 type transport system permease protein